MTDKRKQLWSVKMKNAHKMSKRIGWLKTMKGKTYREKLSIAMKVQHLLDTYLFLDDINYLRNTLGPSFVKLHLEHLKKGAIYEITGGVTQIDIYHYIPSRTVEQDETMIGVMIESERRSGITVNLD